MTSTFKTLYTRLLILGGPWRPSAQILAYREIIFPICMTSIGTEAAHFLHWQLQSSEIILLQETKICPYASLFLMSREKPYSPWKILQMFAWFSLTIPKGNIHLLVDSLIPYQEQFMSSFLSQLLCWGLLWCFRVKKTHDDQIFRWCSKSGVYNRPSAQRSFYWLWASIVLFSWWPTESGT